MHGCSHCKNLCNFLYHLDFTIAKGEEWGQPTTEEALVRQASEKCYQFRRVGKKQ